MIHISELGRKGLIYDYEKLEVNKEYYYTQEDVFNVEPIWNLHKQHILEKANSLNCQVCTTRDDINQKFILKLTPLSEGKI